MGDKIRDFVDRHRSQIQLALIGSVATLSVCGVLYYVTKQRRNQQQKKIGEQGKS